MTDNPSPLPAPDPSEPPDAQRMRELLEHVRKVSRGIVERVNTLLAEDGRTAGGDPDESRPPNRPE